MRCPYCLNKETKVKNKRDGTDTIRRRRECLKCGKRFSTLETITSIGFNVIKKDNTKEPFDIDKMKKGIEIACHERPVSKEEISKMVKHIVTRLEKRGKDVKSKDIGEMVITQLKKYDGVAYIRFNSYYKDFDDAKEFKSFLEKKI